MVWLPDGEKVSKISLFVFAQLTNVTDRQTDRHRITAYTALMHTHRAVKMTTFCNYGLNNWETVVVDRQLTCTKYAISSESEG